MHCYTYNQISFMPHLTIFYQDVDEAHGLCRLHCVFHANTYCYKLQFPGLEAFFTKVRMIEVGRLLMSEDWWIGDLRSKGTVDNSNKLQRGIMMGPAQHRTSLWESNEVVLWRSLGSRIFVLRK